MQIPFEIDFYNKSFVRSARARVNDAASHILRGLTRIMNVSVMIFAMPEPGLGAEYGLIDTFARARARE